MIMETLLNLSQEVARIGAEPWVMPVLMVIGAWTLAAVAIRLALLLLPNRHAMLHYHVRMAMLFGLPVMFLVAWVAHILLQPVTMAGPAPLQWLNTIVVTTASADAPLQESVSLLSMVSSLPFMTGFLAILALLMALVGLIRMVYQLRSLRQIRRHSGLVDYPGELVRSISRKLGVTKRVEVHLHPGVAVPMTIGWRHPRIILPEKTWEDSELELILHHELVHIRRGHFLVRTLEEAVRNLFFIHPLVHLLTREITAWREMACDSELLATSETTRRDYATLLYRALPESGSLKLPALSASISANPDIKKRIETMEHYPRESITWNRSRSTSLALAAIIMIPVLMLASCDFGTTPDIEQEEVFRVIESMPEPIGGMTAIFEHLVYPETARRAGIEGRVIVQFTVDEQGNVIDPEIIQGIGGGCDEAAIDAIKAVEWTPGTQHGEPVSTQYMLPVQFRLDNVGDESSGGDQEGTDAGAFRLDVHVPSTDQGLVELNGERMPFALFSERIRAATSAASSSNGQGNELTVHMSVDGSARMGTVRDVQNVLRENRIHRINYRTL
jgi:TonB family protein